MHFARLTTALALTAALACGGRSQPARVAEQATPPSSADSARAGEPVVLFLGTSLTAGLGLEEAQAYPALIQQKIDSAGLAFRAVNAGVSGETSAGGLRRIDWLLRQPIAVLVLELGANDALRGQDLDATRQNLQQIVDRTRTAHPDCAIVIAGMQAPPNLGQRYTRAFRDLFPALARANHAALIPFLLDSVAAIPRLNQADGMHPTAEGDRIVARNVWRVLEPVLKDREAGGGKREAPTPRRDALPASRFPRTGGTMDRPSKIVCVGRNYVEHAKELGNPMPKQPLLFLKAPSALIGDGEAIVLPPASQRVEHEGEIGVVIGARLKSADEHAAVRGIAGITCANDVTARDLQQTDGQWTRAKGFDTFCPVGPRVVPLSQLGGLDALEVRCRVGGVERQHGRAADMAFSIPRLLSYISGIMTLEPGDLVLTGTPAGVGPLAPGDVVEVEIPGVGVLRNPVAGA